MPYITPERREEIEKQISSGDLDIADLYAGDINYLITSFLDEVLTVQGTNYNTINRLVGVLECVKLELYRRVAAPYEDTKIEENGDVYSV